MKKLLSVFSLAVGLTAFGQEPLDQAYTPTVTPNKKPIEYDYIRQADVFWQKRIWRVIDVNLKMNLPFKYPQEPLIKIIHELAKTGELTVYDNAVENGDQFKKVLPVDDVSKIGVRDDTLPSIDPITGEEFMKPVHKDFEYTDVTKYWLKEDWIFNENTSTMVCRILGLAPVTIEKGSDGTILGDKVMYWVYYPDLRPYFAQKEVYNSKNDAVRLSWDDLFEARMFESFIRRESNVLDRSIKEYASGIDGLLESDRIKQELFEKEHDLWTY